MVQAIFPVVPYFKGVRFFAEIGAQRLQRIGLVSFEGDS